MMLAITFLLFTPIFIQCEKLVEKRALQKSHEKPDWQKWSEKFLPQEEIDQQTHLVKLLRKITDDYLSDCTPTILYDTFAERYDNLLLEKLFTNYTVAYIHGQITNDYKVKVKSTITTKIQASCHAYVLFMKDVMRCKEVIGEQNHNKVVIVSRSSQWRVIEFLSNKESQYFVNLLVITKSGKFVPSDEETPYILYTHKLYIDALASSKAHVLTSWSKGKYTREVNLFPKKIVNGFSGHRFLISVATQPPFVLSKGRADNGDKLFDGYEVRLLNILAKVYNFTTDFREATDDVLIGSGEAVDRIVEKKISNLGIGGLYITQDRLNRVGVSQWHSVDCATFISLSSLAMPRYRAIMGPFNWTVWLALIFIYMFGIFPLAFSDKHTLKHLLTKPEEMENMFWYVFGTFTNCFTFKGRGSWSKAEKMTTRLLVGFYWLFTIIITACYTGSIIAFVTIPIYPDVVDSVKQLLYGGYQIGTLDKNGWPHLFENSSDPSTEKLLRKLDLVPDVESGLRNTTKSFFWKYAFLGSKAQLDYIVRKNFTTTNKRAILHISAECLAPFNVGFSYPRNSIYNEILNEGILMVLQAGILNKLRADVEWDMMRSASGKLLAANSKSGGIKSLTYEDRALTLDDTQGMFLLLAAGFIAGGGCLLSEIFGGCFNLCKRRNRSESCSSIESNPRSHEGQTPREKTNFLHYTKMRNRFESLASLERYYNVDEDETSRNDQECHSENQINCIVHNDACNTNSANSNCERKTSVDINEQINTLFECVFGEETTNNDNDAMEGIDIDESSITKENTIDDKHSPTKNEEN